jgi:hypothetical protein
MDPGFEAVWTKPNPLTAFACAFPRLIWAMWATKYRWPEFGLFAVALEQITVFLERMRFLARNSCSQQKLKDAFASWHWSLSPSRHRHVCRGRPRYLPVPHRAGRQLDRCRPLHRSRRSCALPLIERAFPGLLKDCFLDFESRDGQNPARVPMAAHPSCSIVMTVRRCTCNTFLLLARRFLLSISERPQIGCCTLVSRCPTVRERRRQRGSQKWLILRLPLELSA